MDATRFLDQVGQGVSSEFKKNRSRLSFAEYLALAFNAPERHARNAAQYLKDAIDSFGVSDVWHPSGKIRRFKIFDGQGAQRLGRVAGQEEVQAAIYRALSNFVRSGRINKLIMLHGPNGSAKSSIVDALKAGLEVYSKTDAGALYTFSWVFPSEKMVKGSIGFGEKGANADRVLESFAHLDPENVEARFGNPLREHPLLLIPKPERAKVVRELAAGAKDGFVAPAGLVEGDLSQKSRRIYDALLTTYDGDYLKVLRHVQVERFYVSRRYQSASATVEPQMSVDASYQQITADKSLAHVPPALQSETLYEVSGALVSGNRGIVEYADLLKRPLEAFKYLLGTSENGELPLEHFVLQLDEVLIASSNEKHLAAFKEIPDFASFKARIELIRVPYLRRDTVEQEIYDAQVNANTVGRHVAPHATRVAALWAVLTRLKKPIADRYPEEVRALVERLSPVEKLRLYRDSSTPERLTLAQGNQLRKWAQAVYEESDGYPNYEGRSGASAREVKTALFNAAQSTEFESLHPLAVLQELRAICRDKSVHEFLQQEIVDGFHDHDEFVTVAENEYLDAVDREVRESMGLVSEQQYRELFERYLHTVSSWIKGEKQENRLTGRSEKPDEARMAEFEAIAMPKGEEAVDFRKALIAAAGAQKIDHPDAQLEYPKLFPDVFKRLRDHYYEERKRQLKRNAENILKFLSEDRAGLSAKEQQLARETLDSMRDKFGYQDGSARAAIAFLAGKRYP